MFTQFSSNPVLFRIKYKNRDVIETTQSSTSILGKAVHYAIRTFLGGNDEVSVPPEDSEALRLSLDATMAYLEKYPDGFISWKTNVPNRETLQNLALRAVPQYIREWDRSHIKELHIIDSKLSESIRVKVGTQEISLPIPLVGYPDLAYEDTQNRICIDDHKTTFQYSDPDAIDGGKLLQAGFYYFLVYAKTGRAPYKMTFREYKVSQNKDKSAQTREYVIIYDEMPIVFDLFFRFYQDITDALMGKQVYVPNIYALFDRDIALMAYIHRLDEPDVLEKEMKRTKIQDIAVILQRKMARNRNLKRFMEAKATLFTSHVALNYAKMQPHDKIKYKLMEHGIALNFTDRVEGLSVDLYRYEPSVGTKMSTIEKYQKDVEQALAAQNVRILAPIPGTNLIGFEVPKKKREFVTLPKGKPTGLEIDLGVDVYGKPRTLNLRDAPHVLIAGTTGSGKSKCLESIVTQLIRLPQHEVELALMDPKMVELDEFKDEKHVAFYRDEPAEILQVLMHYLDEMNKRYSIFKKSKVKSLDAYREKVSKDIPYVVIVIDEFGDLIAAGKMAPEIKSCMVRLAQKARAAGIHLIITTQSPRAKVVDGTIKANFPTRIAFQTVSRLESEIIIDRGGADLLLGKGDMLLVGAGANAERLQGFDV